MIRKCFFGMAFLIHNNIPTYIFIFHLGKTKEMHSKYQRIWEIEQRFEEPTSNLTEFPLEGCSFCFILKQLGSFDIEEGLLLLQSAFSDFSFTYCMDSQRL